MKPKCLYLNCGFSCLPFPLSQSMFEPGDGSVMIKSITFTLKGTV
uniref:Uncharacterized protein n=1 Tax=Anguilla anguilla TaxID=7936 RepID=A0A0E9TM17_ANGAN